MVQEEWYREVPYTEPRTQCTGYEARGRNLDSRTQRHWAPEGVSHKDEANKKKPRAGRGS